MNKSDLIKALGKRLDLHERKAEEIVNKVFDTMANALAQGDRIEIRGFGSFTVRRYEGYTGQNPQTGEQKMVAAKTLPCFKVGRNLEQRLNHE